MATTAVQPIDTQLPAAMIKELKIIMGNIPALLPSDIPFEQFRVGLWLEMHQQKELAECTTVSLVKSVIQAANAGLVPGRDCHLIPFKNHGRYEAVFVPKYQGIILTLERTGKIRKAFAHPVYSEDHFEVDYLEDRFSHKPHQTSQRGSLKCFYGCVLLKDGTKHFELMTLEQIDTIRRRAPRHESGPWATDFDEMARKTALKRVAKYVRLSPQQQQLLEDDDTRERTDPSPERFRENVSDMYGDTRKIPEFGTQKPQDAQTSPGMSNEPPPPEKPVKTDPEAHQLIAQIDAAWTAWGLTVAQLDSYWAKAEAQEGLPLRHMTVDSLQRRLGDAQQWIARQKPRHTNAAPVAADVHASAASVIDDAEDLDAALQAFDGPEPSTPLEDC